jgi:CRP/FNR family transcriptional regulator, cyclic AMP receptor protein
MPDRDPKLERLASSPTFAKLGDRKLKSLAPFTDDIEVPAGTTLMREGSVPNELEILVAGHVEISIGGTKVADAGPGSVLGEMALVNRDLRAATVTATEDSHLIVISGRAFAGLVEKHPEIADDLRSLAQRRAEENAEKLG